MAHELSLAAGNVQEFAPAEMVRAAAAADFDAAGLWVEPDTWTAATTREVRARLDESGVPVLDVEVAWIRPGPPDPALERIIEIGGEVGARFVLVVSSDPDRGATKRRFAELCQRAADAGLVAVLEFLPITEIRTLADALDVVRDVAHPSSGILVDALHLARTGGKPDDLRALEPALLPYAQPADAPLAPPGSDVGSLLHEAIDGRLLPGAGELPLRDWLDALPADIPLSPEIRSRTLRERYPDIVARARAIGDATRRWLRS